MWSAGDVAVIRSSPRGKSKRSGIDPPPCHPPTSYPTSVCVIGMAPEISKTKKRLPEEFVGTRRRAFVFLYLLNWVGHIEAENKANVVRVWWSASVKILRFSSGTQEFQEF